jgi:thioredoxin 1
VSKPATTDQKLVSAVTSDIWENEVLESSVPVVVDFYANWCGPCRFVAPAIAALASEYDGKIKFVKLDVDKSEDIADQYNVQSIPTIIIFKSGKKVGSVIGAKSKAELVRFIQKHLGQRVG